MLELLVSESAQDLRDGSNFIVRVALADGLVEPIAPTQLAELGPRMCSSHVKSVREFNEYLANERSDLIYPASGDKNDWQRYLHNAIERLRPREAHAEDGRESDPLGDMFGETPFELLDADAYMEKDFRDTFREALTAPPQELRRRWFASRDQERLVVEVERTAKKIRAGQLAGAEMRFFVDGVHWPRIRDALKASGAQLVQIDPTVPIPPHIEDIAKLPPERTVDPACAAPPAD